MSDRRAEIASWSFDLPADWVLIPMEPEVDGRGWALRAVAEVESQASEPGKRGGIVDELVDLRASLLSREDPWLQAAVSIRPEFQFTVGCVLTGAQLQLDADDTVDAFAGLIAEGFAHPGPGVRTLDSEIWRDDARAGPVVGAYQRFDQQTPGSVETDVYQRLLYGVFPPEAQEMVRLEFTVIDMGTFDDMRATTWALVSSIEVSTTVSA